jgi:Multicopper oxidase
VTVENQGDLETTVHWHGLRLDWRSDGTHERQAPIEVAGTYSCRVITAAAQPRDQARPRRIRRDERRLKACRREEF